MDQKIIISLAPTGGWGREYNNPVRSADIAADVINCARAGASVVHMHARDEDGKLTTNLTAFNNAVQIIKDSCDIILEASTGGLSDFTAAERIVPTENSYAQMGSLNIGSLNFGDEVYKNGLRDVRFWIRTLKERGVKPTLEVFDTGNMETALYLINEGLISVPCNFSFIFDVKWGMPFHSYILSYLIEKVPQNCNWGALFAGSISFANHIEAARRGAKMLRVGFEDSRHYNSRTASTNEELVLALRKELEVAGFSIATTAEARAVLLKQHA
jgi:3-keto-5-aminohexanoate cleavage enzyme